MNTNILHTSILAIALLAGSAASALAQSEAPVRDCPFGHPPGYGRDLTPEQRAEHRAAIQQTMATLRQKQTDGTLTAEEAAWLKNVEERGGPCVSGAPRGRGPGKGPGAGNGRRFRHGPGDGSGPGNGQDAGPGPGRGNGGRHGLRDGTGPRATDGTCPKATPPPVTE